MRNRLSKLISGVLLVVGSFSIVEAAPLLDRDSGKIAVVVAEVLGRTHYKNQYLDDSISGQFLQNYLEALDPGRRFFLQSDVDEFRKKYQASLDDSTLRGNLEPAREIFQRFLDRAQQRTAQVKELVAEKYTFDTDEKVALDREKAPWPASEAEAIVLWKERVKLDLLQEQLGEKPAGNPAEVVQKRYERLLENFRDIDDEMLLEIYLSSLAKTYDPHSEYLSPTDLEDFDIHMKLSMEGIGAVLMLEDGYAKVVEVVAGGPAALDKRLQPGDRIVAVGDKEGQLNDVVNMRLIKIVKQIRGPKGTEVRLLVWPGDAADPAVRKEIVLKRDKIELKAQEARAQLIEFNDEKGKKRTFGSIVLPSFYIDLRGGANGKSATRDVSRLIDELKVKGIEGLILDLRGNAGGSLEEAISMTGLFIKQGAVVQVKDRKGSIERLDDEDSFVAYDGPLVVLVNHLSASASEILAGALQDYGRAVIVGDAGTFGKGTVQKLEDLTRYLRIKNAGALKYTIQKFYRVSGGSTQYRGVVPDIQLPSILDIAEINESSLKNPLPYDEIPAADFEAVQRVSQCLKKLKEASSARISKHPEFAYVREDAARLKKQFDEKTVSLNKAERVREIQATKDREEARKKSRASHPDDTFTVTELSGMPEIKTASRDNGIPSGVINPGLTGAPGEKDPSQDAASQAFFEEGILILRDYIDCLSSHR